MRCPHFHPRSTHGSVLTGWAREGLALALQPWPPCGWNNSALFWRWGWGRAPAVVKCLWHNPRAGGREGVEGTARAAAAPPTPPPPAAPPAPPTDSSNSLCTGVPEREVLLKGLQV